MLSLMRKLKERFLYGGRARLSPSERAIMDALLGAMPEALAKPVMDQITHIRLIQEWSGGRVVRFFLSKAEDAISTKTTEFRLCEFSLSGETSPIRGELVLNRGVISTLEFSRPIKHGLAYGVEEVVVHTNLQENQLVETAKAGYPDLLAAIQAIQDLEGVRVLQPEGMWSFPAEDGTFGVCAEGQSGRLCFRIDGPLQVALLGEDGELIEEMTQLSKDGLRERLAKGF